MDTNGVDSEHILEEIEALIESLGSQNVAAAELGISPQYLSDLLHHRRPVTDSIAQLFGYQKVVTWRKHEPRK
jgi:plasmid maintenance system antidote protein VapI